jgi:predicted permease
MANLVKDCVYALRTFRRSPVFCAVAVLSLALGIGANTAIFTLIDQLILRLLPIRDPRQIVLLWGRGRHYGGNNGRNALSYPMYQDLRDRNQVFSGMMCRYALPVVLGVDAHTEAVGAELVSGNYFPVLGVRPALGRLFTSRDDLHEGQHPYAVLSESFWRTRFASDPGILGRTVRINSYPFTVVGVARRGFDGMEPGLPADVFVPMAMASAVRPGFHDMWDRRMRWVNVYGRLKPGMTIEKAYAGLQPLFHQILDLEVQMPAFRNATPSDKTQFLRMDLFVLPGSQGNTVMRRRYEKPLLVLMGVVGLVLLIACANLASLLTARAASRQKEIAIRLAVGASRGRMVRQLITESLLLAAMGGAAGIGLAILMVEGLLAFLPVTLAGYDISSTPDWRLLAFTFALSLATGIAFGLVPALDSTRPDLAGTLKDLAGSVVGSGLRIGLRKALVTAQVALSLLLLIGAGLFLRSLGNLRMLDPGFRTNRLVQFTVNPRNLGYDMPRAQVFFRRLEDRLRGLPGVEAAGLSDMGVLNGNDWDMEVTIEGHPRRPGEEALDPHFNSVTPGYFDALGMHVLAGRNFLPSDDSGAPKAAIVNASFARHAFGDELAVGRHLGIGSDLDTPTNIEIVGVVNDTRYESLRARVPDQVFLCYNQRPDNAAWAYLRTTHDPTNVFHEIRAAMHDLEPNLPLTNFKTLDEQLNESLVTERLIATLSSVFGALATLLALIGVYGVMAYMVARRAREIGIRIALGAGSGRVLWLIMREVLTVVAAGIAVGAPAALALSRLVQSQLYDVEPDDPASIVMATLLLAAVAALAGFIPASRAAASDPASVLRES